MNTEIVVLIKLPYFLAEELTNAGVGKFHEILVDTSKSQTLLYDLISYSDWQTERAKATVAKCSTDSPNGL